MGRFYFGCCHQNIDFDLAALLKTLCNYGKIMPENNALPPIDGVVLIG
jgi:hypothetical protein